MQPSMIDARPAGAVLQFLALRTTIRWECEPLVTNCRFVLYIQMNSLLIHQQRQVLVSQYKSLSVLERNDLRLYVDIWMDGWI